MSDTFYSTEIAFQKLAWCDTCYRLRKLGILDYQGRVDVEHRQYDEEGM